MSDNLRHPSQVRPERPHWVVPPPEPMEPGWYAVPGSNTDNPPTKGKGWLPVLRNKVRMDVYDRTHIKPHAKPADADMVNLDDDAAEQRALAAAFRMRCGYVLHIAADGAQRWCRPAGPQGHHGWKATPEEALATCRPAKKR